jgi:hypothetical protein
LEVWGNIEEPANRFRNRVFSGKFSLRDDRNRVDGDIHQAGNFCVAGIEGGHGFTEVRSDQVIHAFRKYPYVATILYAFDDLPEINEVVISSLMLRDRDHAEDPDNEFCEKEAVEEICRYPGDGRFNRIDDEKGVEIKAMVRSDDEWAFFRDVFCAANPHLHAKGYDGTDDPSEKIIH